MITTVHQLHDTSNDNSYDEIWCLLKERFGYDFTGYSKSSVNRRLQQFMVTEKIACIEDLQVQILRHPEFHVKLAQNLTVNFTEMFRDPLFYRSLVKKVFPFLSTYPTIKIWHAGCSTGEEVYSLAILLEEYDLLKRTKIYATDINETCLFKAEKSVYSSTQVRKYTRNYILAGGRRDFSEYYTAQNNGVTFREELRRNISFFPHNLATDSSFNEFHLILCRNVLIYFNRDLQNKVVKLFLESLNNLGYLALGNKETLLFNELKTRFAFIDKEEKIYRKVMLPGRKV